MRILFLTLSLISVLLLSGCNKQETSQTKKPNLPVDNQKSTEITSQESIKELDEYETSDELMQEIDEILGELDSL